jgi:hypothetical protein
MAHDVGMEAMKQHHAMELSAQEHAQTLTQGAQQAQTAQQSQQSDQQHQAEMAQQAQEAAAEAQPNGSGQ